MSRKYRRVEREMAGSYFIRKREWDHITSSIPQSSAPAHQGGIHISLTHFLWEKCECSELAAHSSGDRFILIYYWTESSPQNENDRYFFIPPRVVPNSCWTHKQNFRKLSLLLKLWSYVKKDMYVKLCALHCIILFNNLQIHFQLFIGTF